MSKAKDVLPKEWFLSKQLCLVQHPFDALEKVDALVLMTEWPIFLEPDFELMKKRMRHPVIFDGRNQYNPDQCRQANFIYFGIGRGSEVPMLSNFPQAVGMSH
jgi:UDPglucose 6-dehydrogenase